MASTSAASMPAFASAPVEAWRAMLALVSSSVTQRLPVIPVRSTIHSSEVSMYSAHSWFDTIRYPVPKNAVLGKTHSLVRTGLPRVRPLRTGSLSGPVGTRGLVTIKGAEFCANRRGQSHRGNHRLPTLRAGQAKALKGTVSQ